MSDPLSIQNNRFVSIDELNTVLRNLLTHHRPIVTIEFANEIERIDIAFIAGLILCAKKFEIQFDINYPESKNFRLFEVRLYLKQFSEIFECSWKDAFSHFKGIDDLKKDALDASRSFAPILLIDKHTINLLFGIREVPIHNTALNSLVEKYLADISAGTSLAETHHFRNDGDFARESRNYSVIHAFVFRVMYNKVSRSISWRPANVTKAIRRVEEIWDFTTEYVVGLHELAKNIVEHSDDEMGMITLRAYDDREVSDDKVLETHVFDFGSKGIIPTLTERTKAKSGNRIYEEDLRILNDNFQLKDFIKPSVKTKLNQQLYRDLAHYGLMKFYKLISRNDGAIVSSSIGKVNYERHSYFSHTGVGFKSINWGTSYYFQLPFKPELFTTISTQSQAMDPQASADTIKSLSELLNFETVNDKQELKAVREGKKILYVVHLDLNVSERDDEAKLASKFAFLEGLEKVAYIAIDMEKISLSPSSLLRFLAHLSTTYVRQHLIVFNLDFEIYEQMISDNENFYSSVKDLEENVPYWYADKGLLIFSRLKNMNFAFADILYGKNSDEFVSINYIVGNTVPNTVRIIEKRKPSADDFAIPSCLEHFFYKRTLLPLDVLIGNSNGESLFQSNLKTLLEQQLQIPERSKVS
ncbi:MAG: hypothetical protein ABL999_07500 [Pyrinomonadaceae bacterium]